MITVETFQGSQAESITDAKFWHLAISDDNRRIGVVALSDFDWMSRSVVLVWDFQDDRFYMEVIQSCVHFVMTLNLQRLTCEVLEDNLPVQRAVELCGFRQEGCRRKSVYKPCKYLDSYVYAYLGY